MQLLITEEIVHETRLLQSNIVQENQELLDSYKYLY